MPLSFGAGRATRNAGGFFGGPLRAQSIGSAAQIMQSAGETITPKSGGTLTINDISLGSYDYIVRNGSQTISSFNASDWFTSTEDTRSAWIVVNGNMTINSGQTFIPSVRKLFTVIYVNGNLTVNGSISMTARGANHSGTGNSGGATTAGAIRIINGTYSSITNPQIPATGGSAGAGGIGGAATVGGTGGAATSGGTGGGGGGGGGNNGTGGAGVAGTSFSAGGGGGGANDGVAGAAVINGGKGGNAQVGFNANSCGGAGNPGGDGNLAAYAGTGTSTPESGTGGVLIIFCNGAVSGSGSITSNGSRGGGGGNTIAGGGSGGGSVTLLYTSGTPPTITANGGAGNNGNTANPNGGSGGAGTARALVLV